MAGSEVPIPVAIHREVFLDKCQGFFDAYLADELFGAGDGVYFIEEDGVVRVPLFIELAVVIEYAVAFIDDLHFGERFGFGRGGDRELSLLGWLLGIGISWVLHEVFNWLHCGSSEKE